MSETIPAKKLFISEDLLSKGMSYHQYQLYVADLFAQNRVTGNEQREDYLAYTKLNMQREHRWDKHYQPGTEMISAMAAIRRPQRWIVLTEGWCGDSAQNLPAIEKMAALNPLVRTIYYLRDENEELMQQLLLNGSRSIPVVVAIDEEHNILWKWGSRPAEAIALMAKNKAEGMDSHQVKEKLHLWYAQNKQQALEGEMLKLVTDSL